MENLFARYMRLREETEDKPVQGVTATIKLQKKDGSKEFSPLIVDKSHHSNLAKIVTAFLNSDKVKVGYTTIEKNKGEVEPLLKKKTLYLTGGAVRDHLMGKTPRNYDLVTDATPSEIRMILSQNGFTEVKPEDKLHTKLYTSLPIAGKKNKMFHASKWDGKGKEMTITAIVNGQSFDISTLSKSPKSRFHTPEEAKTAASIEEDAANRDFTINAMYIPLTKDDGPNSELIDPFGGANHLKTGEIKSIGEKFKERMDEDPMTAFRMVNHFNRFGQGDELPEKYKNVVTAHKSFGSVPHQEMKNAFLSGLENADVDPRKYMKTAHSAGLLQMVFPNIKFDLNDLPQNFRGDRWLATAWVLKDNDPEMVEQVLMNSGWSKQEAGDISFLVKMYNWSKNKFDSGNFCDMAQTHYGITKGKVRDWMQMMNAYGPEVDKFLDFDYGDLMPYQHEDDGRRKVNPLYIKVLGRSPIAGEFDLIKRNLMTNRWKDSLNKLQQM